MKTISKEEVRSHNKPGDCWIIVQGKVYDVSTFAKEHPGGKKILEGVSGQDASDKFVMFHAPDVLQKYAHLQIGVVGEGQPSKQESTPSNDVSLVPYGDPSWEQGFPSPYYNESHHRFRKALRAWVEKEIMPHVHEWDEAKAFPPDLRKKAANVGWLAGAVGLKWPVELAGSKVVGDIDPKDFDYFHEFIIYDELSRTGSVGITWGLSIANGIAIPPIVEHGTKEMIEKVVKPVFRGDKSMALCITEPYGGSDVGNLKTVAKKTSDGKYYIVNGEKKWITNGIYADFFTVAVRTGGPSYGGISLLLLERGMPGLKTKHMKCSGVWPSGTTYVTFEDVKVPVQNLIGKENDGFKYIMHNFNHERWTISIQSLRLSRVCIEESFKYAQKRKTFNKPLIENQVIRAKLGNMIRQVEAMQAYLEQITYQLTKLSRKEANLKLAGPIALAKVQSTLLVEYCAREAIQIFGGLGYTRGGQGDKVERIYREVRSLAIGGGSEEVMLDLGVRQAMKLQNSKL